MRVAGTAARFVDPGGVSISGGIFIVTIVATWWTGYGVRVCRRRCSVRCGRRCRHRGVVDTWLGLESHTQHWVQVKEHGEMDLKRRAHVNESAMKRSGRKGGWEGENAHDCSASCASWSHSQMRSGSTASHGSISQDNATHETRTRCQSKPNESSHTEGHTQARAQESKQHAPADSKCEENGKL